MISAAIVKVSALGGIALVWWEFTCEAIKIGQKIIFPPEEPRKYQCEYCEELDVRYGDEKNLHLKK